MSENRNNSNNYRSNCFTNRDTNRFSNRDTNRFSNRDTNRYSNRDTNRYSNRDSNRESNRDTNHYSNRDSNRESNRDTNHYSNRDSNRESNRDTNHYSNRDTNRYSNSESKEVIEEKQGEEKQGESKEVIEEKEFSEEPVKTIEKWDELDIDDQILRGIYAIGFENPSPIQKKAIIPIIEGRDIIAQAQSGTGKTATFSIGALSQVDINSNTQQVLILSPTHELTRQTTTVIKSIAFSMDKLKIQTLVGGSSLDIDIEKMRSEPPHIIAGCPGRVYDMLRRGIIKSNTLKLVILDEADELLSSGFQEQVYNIFQHFKKDTQVALFSATLPDNIKYITDQIMRNPVKISVKAESLTLEGIKQYFVAVEDDGQKYDTLKDIYQVISVSQCIIYANSINRVSDLYEAMKQDGFPVCCIHSGMDKIEREKSFTEFRSGSARVLISSNITARGIDIQQVSVVINFDIPRDVHTYLHRIGRSGRWGRKGTGINFVTRRDVIKIKEIEQYYSTQIEAMPAVF